MSIKFEFDRPWRLDELVAVRPEPFGALLYHYGTRRLSFLKDPTVLTVVRSLTEHPSARSACEAAGVTPQSMPAYERALATLAGSAMIRPTTICEIPKTDNPKAANPKAANPETDNPETDNPICDNPRSDNHRSGDRGNR